MQDDIATLKRDLESLKGAFYQGKFLTSQDFSQYARFNTRLKIPRYSSDPTVGEVGEIIEVGGTLKICSSANVFTIVGTQS